MTNVIWRAECLFEDAKLHLDWRNLLTWYAHGRKVGGLYHWRIGRLGGSFYWKR